MDNAGEAEQEETEMISLNQGVEIQIWTVDEEEASTLIADEIAETEVEDEVSKDDDEEEKEDLAMG